MSTQNKMTLIKPLVITEGKTDWKHLKAALSKLRELGHYIDLHLALYEYNHDMGDGELLKVCESHAKIPQLRPCIFIFDRDKSEIIKKVSEEKTIFKSWGNNIFSFALPVPEHRQDNPNISIEFYYKDEEIKQKDSYGRRLFFSNEFHQDSGSHVTENVHCLELNKVQSPTVSIIENKVFDRETNKNIALPKNNFADNILNQEEKFNDFDVSAFKKVFDTIVEIVKTISVTGLALEGLSNYVDLPLIIQSPTKESLNNRYMILGEPNDTSHAMAKRYSEEILVSESLSKHEIKQIIQAETEILKLKEHYRSGLTEVKWKGTPAHVIWLFVFVSKEDAVNYNYFCRSEWISDVLNPRFAPAKMKGNDSIGDIIIDWNKDYLARKRLYAGFAISRNDYLSRAKTILETLEKEMIQIIQITDSYKSNQLSYDEYVIKMQNMEPVINELDHEAGNIGLPPYEIKDFASTFRSMTGFAFNTTFPFSENAINKWKLPNQQIIVEQAIKYYLP